jgi:hypothetical protein
MLLFIAGAARRYSRFQKKKPDSRSLHAKVSLWLATLLFTFGLVGFTTGNAMHFTANMSSRSWQAANTVSEEERTEMLDFWRDYYQHRVSHYFFLAGGLLMMMGVLWVYYDTRIFAPIVFSSTNLLSAPPLGGSPSLASRNAAKSKIDLSTDRPAGLKDIILFWLAIFSFTLLLTGVAAQFPAGPIVAFSFCGSYLLLHMGWSLAVLYVERQTLEATCRARLSALMFGEDYWNIMAIFCHRLAVCTLIGVVIATPVVGFDGRNE